MYWCSYCGYQADSPSEIVHADDCRNQTHILEGDFEKAMFFCDACNETLILDGRMIDCPFCHGPLKTIDVNAPKDMGV